MAEESVSILRVDTGEAVKSVNDLKENIKALKKNLGELTIGSQEYTDTLNELKVNQNALKDAMYATSSSLDDVIESATGASESYNSLVHRMAALKKEWRATNNEARRNEIGQQIGEINQRLKDMDASVGNFQRNVGNYSSALDGLADGFKATAGGAGAVINPVKNVTAGMKALSATPVIAILGLLAGVLDSVIKNLKTSETNINVVTASMAPFASIGDLLTKTMQLLGKAVAKVASYLGDLAMRVFPKLREASELRNKITEEEIALSQKQREVEMANADAQLEIAKLKAQAAEKDKYTASERLKFIEEAAAKEKEIADRNIELARKEYEVLLEKSKLSENSKEDNDALADAYVKLQNAETDYFNKTRELAAQRVEALRAIKAETAATKENAEAKIELADAEDALAAGLKRRSEARKSALAEEKANNAWYDEMWEENNAELEASLDEEIELYGAAYLREKQMDEERAKSRIATIQSVAAATSQIMSSLADMYESDEKNSERNAKKIKALRIASATIDMLQGAVTAFTSAQSLGVPFGQIVGAANAAAVIAMGVANINKIKSTNFSSGGGSVSATAPVAVNAPNVETQLTTTRNLTSASEEERLNRMASNQRVYILQSDIEAAGTQSKAQVAESSF